MHSRPIVKLGQSHIPTLEGLLFFGLFSCETEKLHAIPVAKGEGYFFDLRRGRSTILPYYMANIDADQKHFADSLIVQNTFAPNQLALIPETIFSVSIAGSVTEIWKSYLSPQHMTNFLSALDEFKSFFPALNCEVSI